MYESIFSKKYLTYSCKNLKKDRKTEIWQTDWRKW